MPTCTKANSVCEGEDARFENGGQPAVPVSKK